MSAKHIAILGAGPIGLEAALAAVAAGFSFTLYEAAPVVAGHMAQWAHVRLFTPWEMNVSPQARAALLAAGIDVPADQSCPTGGELRTRVLEPISKLPQVAPHLRLGARVVAVGRSGLLKHEEIASAQRARRPFRLLVRDPAGEHAEAADVVLDCTGSYAVPNALGDAGIPAPGEEALGSAIVHRIPDFERDGRFWGGKTILVVGAGHSAQTAVRDLAELAKSAPGTRVIWAVRGMHPLWGNIVDDPLPERAGLAKRATELSSGLAPAVSCLRGVAVERLERCGGHIAVTLAAHDGTAPVLEVDQILCLTGAVGDHTLYRQLQVHECYATSGPMKLAAALLGAGGGDCLAQTSHGPDTLKNPEPGFFILGAKSYGRNTTFLMRTGWEQVSEVFSVLS